MTATDLYLQLLSKGFVFRADGDRLMVSPADRLTAEDRQTITAHKEALLGLLAPSVRTSVAPGLGPDGLQILDQLRNCYRGTSPEYHGPTLAWLLHWSGLGEATVDQGLEELIAARLVYVWQQIDGQRPVKIKRVALRHEDKERSVS